MTTASGPELNAALQALYTAFSQDEIDIKNAEAMRDHPQVMALHDILKDQLKATILSIAGQLKPSKEQKEREEQQLILSIYNHTPLEIKPLKKNQIIAALGYAIQDTTIDTLDLSDNELEDDDIDLMDLYPIIQGHLKNIILEKNPELDPSYNQSFSADLKVHFFKAKNERASHYYYPKYSKYPKDMQALGAPIHAAISDYFVSTEKSPLKTQLQNQLKEKIQAFQASIKYDTLQETYLSSPEAQAIRELFESNRFESIDLRGLLWPKHRCQARHELEHESEESHMGAQKLEEDFPIEFRSHFISKTARSQSHHVQVYDPEEGDFPLALALLLKDILSKLTYTIGRLDLRANPTPLLVSKMNNLEIENSAFIQFLSLADFCASIAMDDARTDALSHIFAALHYLKHKRSIASLQPQIYAELMEDPVILPLPQDVANIVVEFLPPIPPYILAMGAYPIPAPAPVLFKGPKSSSPEVAEASEAVASVSVVDPCKKDRIDGKPSEKKRKR